MCGIVGIIGIDNKPESSVLDSLIHRGPDSHCDFFNPKIYLGHTRLSIQDLSEQGHQPMLSPDKSHVIVFNGEVYNHRELREEYLSDVPFKGHSDTETILYGYIKYGESFIKKLNGIFALCIYNISTGEVIIARDYFGVKPLYYYLKDNNFYFASEIKALLSLPFDRELDIQTISNYLYFLYSPGANTPFQNVKKLLPGHWIKFNVKTLDHFILEKYYELPFDGEYFNDYTESQLVSSLDEKLSAAVERQMLSDVPVGFFLSGGLDSSTVVAMARKYYPDRQLECYTIDTGGTMEGFADDLKYAKRCAQHLNVHLNVIKADIDILQDFDNMIWHLDEPQADAAPLNVLNICKAARENNDVVLLGGTAGDDLFSGYRRHQALNYEKYFSLLPSSVWALASKASSQLRVNHPSIRRAQKLLKDAGRVKLTRMAGYYSWLNEERVQSLFLPEKRLQLKQNLYNDLLINSLLNIPDEKESLNQMLYWELKYFLADHNLNYTDKMSMAVGVEVRVPFLDKDLVDFSTKIPVHFKMKGSETKYILKKAMEPYLPKDIIYRPKTGFGAPVREWITKDLRPMIDERLSKKNIEKWGIFEHSAIQQLVDDNQRGKIDASYSIWALLAIQSWLEQFVKE
jgi:asparagine synthase (glutamine-hydrolysing)